MKFAEFFSQIRGNEVELSLEEARYAPPARLSNEAMFHLPLIAMTILALSKGLVKPRVSAIGQLVGDCFERTFVGFRGSAQHLGWSASLRVRTVQALDFLEQAQLVTVDDDRRIIATQAGKKVVQRAMGAEQDLSANLMAIERAYRDIRSERQIKLSPYETD